MSQNGQLWAQSGSSFPAWQLTLPLPRWLLWPAHTGTIAEVSPQQWLSCHASLEINRRAAAKGDSKNQGRDTTEKGSGLPFWQPRTLTISRPTEKHGFYVLTLRKLEKDGTYAPKVLIATFYMPAHADQIGNKNYIMPFENPQE